MSDIINRPEFDSYRYSLLQRGHDFGMKLDRGKSAFGKVLDYEDSVQLITRYASLATKTAAVAFGSGSTVSWNEWENANNHKYFREMRIDHILQVFIGIWPRQLRWWFQYPAGNTHGNLSEIEVDTPALVSSGGYIDGINSTWEDPSRQTEIMVPREMKIMHMIFNPTMTTVMPKIKLFIRRYRVKWYDYNKSDDQVAIREMSKFIYSNKGSPVHYYSPGVDNFAYGIQELLGIPAVDAEELGGVNYNE